MSVPTVIAVVGGIALLIGIFGGGVKAKEIEIPLINARVRVFSIITGMVLLITAALLSSPVITTPAPTQIPNLTDALLGNWSGTIKSLDGSFSTKLDLSFESGCRMNEICGTYSAPQISCSGTLTLVGIDGNSFVFLETRTRAESSCGFCYEHIQKLSDNSISYGCSSTGFSKDIQSTGILSKP